MFDIIIADNQSITAAGIKYLLQSAKNVQSITDVSSKHEVIKYLSAHTNNTLIVLDYALFDFQSVDELLNLSDRFSQSYWLLFSETLSNDFLRRLLFSDSSFSVVLKNADIDEINLSLFYTLRGERYICNRVSNQMLSVHSTTSKDKTEHLLTPTEKEILKEIALGRTTKEIAAERNLSIHTIVTHRKNIFRKLEVNNVYEAIKHAMRAGIVDQAEYYI